MDIGLERKLVKCKPGINVHYYTWLSPALISLEIASFPSRRITAEEICIRVFTSQEFKFTEREFSQIEPAFMHLFQLYDCESHHWQAPNRVYELSENTSLEFVLRIRFKFPPSLEKINFSEIWEEGCFYYYFAQCRHDFINDILHDMYHSHIKEDHAIGIAYVDMARLAFEQDLKLKQLKSQYNYHDFLPRHVARRTKNLLVKLKFSKSFDSALEETYESFRINNNPLRVAIVSYLKQLLPSVPDYYCEQFALVGQDSLKVGHLQVHPYHEKQSGISVSTPKGTQLVNPIANLMAIDVSGRAVLLHFLDSSPKRFELESDEDAVSLTSLLDGYYRLIYNYHYCLSNQVYSPIVKCWNELKCFGPLSKDSLKTVWKRHGNSPHEGTFLIKQKTNSFTDYVIVVHKMGRSLPAVVVKYNEQSNMYSCDDLKALFQSHHHEPEFPTVKHLIRYYRTGDSKNFKLGTQLSPLPREGSSLMICRDRVLGRKDSKLEIAFSSLDLPVVFKDSDITIGRCIKDSGPFFEVMEAVYGREPVVVWQIKGNIENRDTLVLYYQKDVQKCLHWNHDMIVRTFGICLSPFYVVSQNMPEGNLWHLLRKRGDNVQLHHRVQATGQLAQALLYLETHGYTHGNIRSKYLLVSRFDSRGDIAVKLSGGAMTTYLSSLPITDRLNIERLPWLALERWTSLNMETVESDVYSFGVTVWEIFCNGERPLAHYTTSEEVKYFMESGKELPVPSTIAALSSQLNPHAEPMMKEQHQLLVDVLYRHIILDNCSPDPSQRMKPQDIVKESTLLNTKVTPHKYELVTAQESELRSSPKVAHRKSSVNSLHNGVYTTNHRPLPSLPPPPKTEPYLIEQRNLLGVEGAKKLGSGFYGEVFRCKLLRDASKEPTDCAVKRLFRCDKDEEDEEKSLVEFEQELRIMTSLEHRNIVTVFGQCFYTYPDSSVSRMIVMEYVRNGSLSMFTVRTAKHLPRTERLPLFSQFAADIAEGMRFLHSLNDGKGIIHRDLAARNVLITEQPYRAKLTDFGLARRLVAKDYYRCNAQSSLPVLWCAPESLGEFLFTKATDVWSYAVVLWEMYSCSCKPIIPAVKMTVREDGVEIMDPASLLEVLNSSAPGMRLPKLDDIDTQMYNLMMRCWSTDPSRRPTFDDIRSELDTFEPLPS